MILGLIAFIIYIFQIKKTYWIKIRVSRLIGNVPTEVAEYSAKQVAFGRAGDMLWRVAPAGIVKIKLIKWLPVGKLQSGQRLFKYFIRNDGEWINYIDDNIDEVSKKMGVRFVQEDMRLQRLATDRLLEERLMEKNFWEKWKETIMLIIVFLVIAVSMAIIFYQMSKVLDKVAPIVSQIGEAVKQMVDSNKMLMKYCNINSTATTGLIPTQ